MDQYILRGDDINNSLHDLRVEHWSFMTVLVPVHKLIYSLVFKMSFLFCFFLGFFVFFFLFRSAPIVY